MCFTYMGIIRIEMTAKPENQRQPSQPRCILSSFISALNMFCVTFNMGAGSVFKLGRGGGKPEARAKNHLPPVFLLGFRSLHFGNRSKCRKNKKFRKNSFCIMFKLEGQRPSSKKSWRGRCPSCPPVPASLLPQLTSHIYQRQVLPSCQVKTTR